MIHNSYIENRYKYKVSNDFLLFILIGIIWYVTYLVMDALPVFQVEKNGRSIYFLSVCGVVQFVITLRSLKKLQGRLFSPFFVFFVFLYIFNFGQFALWAFGIHYETEMTSTHFIRYIDPYTALKMQVISLQLLAFFYVGVLFSQSLRQRKKSEETINYRNSIYRLIARPMIVISGLISIVITFIMFRNASVQGYSIIFETNIPSILKYISYMFVPSVFLNLCVSNYSKKEFRIMSIVFMLYAVPLLVMGDRSSWVYFLGVWIWAYIKFVASKVDGVSDKKEREKNRKRMIMAGVLVLVIIFVSAQFVSVRDMARGSITLNNFDFSDLFTPFIKPFFEMGQSAVCLGVIIQDKINETWSYGNTYISAFLGMVLPRVRVLFGYQDFYIENWLSSYLNMGNYGVGFSAFAEAFLNGGSLFSGFFIMLYGLFIGRLTIVKESINRYDVQKIFLATSSAVVLLPSTRGSLDLYLRMLFWGVLLIEIVTSVVCSTRR